MPQPKDVIDLLAAQPDETLDGMAEQLQGTIAQAQAQLELVEAARNRRGRRRPTRQDTPAAGEGSRAHYLKRDELFQIVAEQARPVSPSEIHAVLIERNFDIAPAAVRTGMARLVRDGRLVRLDGGGYAVNYEREIAADSGNGNGSSNPLFRDDGPGSEEATRMATSDRGSR